MNPDPSCPGGCPMSPAQAVGAVWVEGWLDHHCIGPWSVAKSRVRAGPWGHQAPVQGDPSEWPVDSPYADTGAAMAVLGDGARAVSPAPPLPLGPGKAGEGLPRAPRSQPC